MKWIDPGIQSTAFVRRREGWSMGARSRVFRQHDGQHRTHGGGGFHRGVVKVRVTRNAFVDPPEATGVAKVH